jgi:hypothetical protein
MRFRFTIRDLLWLTIVVALAAWQLVNHKKPVQDSVWHPALDLRRSPSHQLAFTRL